MESSACVEKDEEAILLNVTGDDTYYYDYDVKNEESSAFSISKNETLLMLNESKCFPFPTGDEREAFIYYEKILGGYIIILFGIFGLFGNLLCTITLGRKDMRKNCFNQLCIGKSFYVVNINFACKNSNLCRNF